MISEEEMMKHVQIVTCRYMPNCKDKHNKQACLPCRRNDNHVPTIVPIDNYKEKVLGLKFL